MKTLEQELHQHLIEGHPCFNIEAYSLDAIRAETIVDAEVFADDLRFQNYRGANALLEHHIPHLSAIQRNVILGHYLDLHDPECCKHYAYQ